MANAIAPSRISDCLLSASNESLCSALALLNELSLGNLIWSKGADVAAKVEKRMTGNSPQSEANHFHEKLVARSKEYAEQPAGEQLLQVIGALQQLLSITPRDLQTMHDLCDVAEDVGMATVNLLQQEKEAKFSGSDLASLIEYQMANLFGDLSIRMGELSPTQQQTLVDRVREFLQSLPADQQRFVMNKLGTSDLSDAAIRSAISTGAMWTAMTAAVQVFGFAFIRRPRTCWRSSLSTCCRLVHMSGSVPRLRCCRAPGCFRFSLGSALGTTRERTAGYGNQWLR